MHKIPRPVYILESHDIVYRKNLMSQYNIKRCSKHSFHSLDLQQ